MQSPRTPYEVRLRRQAQRSLRQLSERTRTRLLDTLDQLALQPRPPGVGKLRPRELWRIRVGTYRIIYAIDDSGQAITVVRVGHRREVYRDL